MIATRAFTAARIFDGQNLRENCAVLVAEEIVGVVPLRDLPSGCALIDTKASILSPGFVDWQVNGGGGVLLNDCPSVEGVAHIAKAHLPFGTTALLPTVISDHPDVTRSAAQAVKKAMALGTAGVVGIHFEGPHISLEKKGVHEPSFIRAMTGADLDLYSAGDMGAVVVTVAPENTTMAQIRELASRGVIVSIGHSSTDYDTAKNAFRAGASVVTHIFNAMSPLLHRAPGLIGAAMENPDIFCGIIADGHHVHPAALRMIFAAGPTDRLTLVTDAMSSVGDEANQFELNGRTVYRENGKLALADGTLAGSDLDMISAIRFSVDACGVTIEDALQMATSAPANMLRLSRHGRFAKHAHANMIALNDRLEIQAIWLEGREIS